MIRKLSISTWKLPGKLQSIISSLIFHGAYKPDGLGRTWPNALTREGVKGMENDKWSREITPEHDVNTFHLQE